MFPDIIHVLEFPYFQNQGKNINSLLDEGWILLCVAPSGSTNDDGLKFYDIESGKPFKHHIDTGNNYKKSTMEIKLFDSIKVDEEGKPNKEYKDETYEYYVFK